MPTHSGKGKDVMVAESSATPAGITGQEVAPFGEGHAPQQGGNGELAQNILLDDIDAQKTDEIPVMEGMGMRSGGADSAERAKAEALGMEPDAERSAGAYEHESNGGTVEELQAHISARYRRLTTALLADAQPRIQELMQEGHVRAVLPMKETLRTLDETLLYLTARLPPGFTTVVDGGSSKEALAPVREHEGAVVLVRQDDILSTLDWTKLVPVLGLKERPRGKGTTLLAGFLWEWAFRQVVDNPIGRIIYQSDSDISKGYTTYNPLDRLLHPFVTETGRVLAAKTAMGGRGNESVMLARTLLGTLALTRQDGVSTYVRRRASEVMTALIGHKWMLTGELAFTDGTMMRRPVATGYLDETVAAIAMEDEVRGATRKVLHVSNANPRLDLPNDGRKEQIMMQCIAQALLAIVLYVKPLSHLSLEDITQLNEELAHCNLAAIIHGPPFTDTEPDMREEPVLVERIRQDRLYPPINMLVDKALVDGDALVRLVRKCELLKPWMKDNTGGNGA